MHTRMTQCLSGSAHGATKLAAFHAALRAVGMAEANLVRLSSVIPRGWNVTQSQQVPVGMFPPGAIIPAVYSIAVSDEGCSAAASLAHVVSSSGGGYFAESEPCTYPYEAETSAMRSLLDMIEGDGRVYDEPKCVTASIQSMPGRHACALVIAPFGWLSANSLNEFVEVPREP
ncbi:arginine decarboxylase, pyruvoyl-dependent [Brooklawnia propionicigenes]|uniref:Pyruvoyl-dependent arginine decarboxylase AaxB n=2 Tax=Brooklawnia propionicigenes TaxID=3041175 RepID=A0AAN0K6U0_9ACTN|nr:arginine decarboxylase, pyruvoyl-dependent [Brooklawnia sp. SH051]